MGDESAPLSGLDVKTAVAMAMTLHQKDRLEDAERAWNMVLATWPGQPDAIHYLGLLRHQRGDSKGAIEMIRDSLRIAPRNAHAWVNLGNVLRSVGLKDESADAFRRAVHLDPRNPAALNNLGVALKDAGKLVEAEEVFRRAIELAPDYADTRRNLGALLGDMGRTADAMDEWASAARREDDAAPFRNLANGYYRAGRPDRAAEMVREWLRRDPGSQVAKHMLVSLAGGSTPERASDGYVRGVFDSFASTFDEKLAALGYRAPDLIAAAIDRALGPPAPTLRVLDAGCGTGLCAPLLAPRAARLVGVDLSGGMLAKARARGGYHELVEAELTAFLAQHPAAFDLVASADTFVYFGNLSALLAATAAALTPGGLLAFTVEREPDGGAGFRLNTHGRYSHAESYVRAKLADSGLSVVEVREDVLRQEAGGPAVGLVVTARKAAP